LLILSMKSKPTKKVKKKELTTEEALKRLGERIKELRLKKGFTSYEVFAYENEISRAQFGRYEKGEDMRFTSLLRVVKALDISLEDFFSEGFD